MATNADWKKTVRALLPNGSLYRKKMEAYVETHVKGRMYSIDKQIARIKNTGEHAVKLKTGKLEPDHTLVLNLTPRNEFDLINADLFDTVNRIVKDAENPKDYDLAFSNRLASIYPIYRCADFLEHHYNQTPDKPLFLKHVKYHILPIWGDAKPSLRTDFVRDWISKKEGSPGSKGDLQNEPEDKAVHIDFKSFLTVKGKKALPYLRANYKKARPQVIAFMLFALNGLGFLKPIALTKNQVELHLALKVEFGDIGTRQALNVNIYKLQRPDQYQTAQIETHRMEILKALSKK